MINARKLKLVVVPTAIILLSGCATAISSKDHKKLIDSYKSGDYANAAVIAEKSLGFYDEKSGDYSDIVPTKIDNALLHMEAAEANRLMGNDERALKHYNVVDESLFKERDEKFISAAYEPTPGERVLSNFYKSITYWGNNDIENTNVEFLRAYERNKEAVNRYANLIEKKKKEGESESKAISELQNDEKISGMNSAVGKWDVYQDFANPIVSFTNALFNASQNGVNDSDAEYEMRKAIDMAVERNIPEDIFNYSDMNDNKVWIIAETGVGPHLEENRFDIPFVYKDMPLVLQMAFPEVVQAESSVALSNYMVNSSNIPFYQLTTMDKLVKTELKKRWPGIVTSQIIQAIAKAVIQYKAQKEGKNAGIAALLLTSAITGADTTIWKMTPNNWSVAKLDNSSENILEVRYANAVEKVEIPQGSSIVYIKQPTAVAKPYIEILKL